jgi:hypothetical protein
MGDARRFDRFADFIVRNWPDRSLRIADVAGGKGGLNAALHQRGYRSVVSFDKRRNRANPARQHYRYALFGEGIVEPFGLIAAMHPDEATDVALAWALRNGVPYAIVPCCAKPSEWVFSGGEVDWVTHLLRHAGPDARTTQLPITGKNVVIFRREVAA